MPKFKPHKGLLKRIRITKSGKIKVRVANGSHLRSGKTAARLQDMRQPRYFGNYGILKRARKLLGRAVAGTVDSTARPQAAATKPAAPGNVKTSKRRNVKTKAATASAE
jgi:ribosomal protein L35